MEYLSTKELEELMDRQQLVQRRYGLGNNISTVIHDSNMFQETQRQINGFIDHIS